MLYYFIVIERLFFWRRFLQKKNAFSIFRRKYVTFILIKISINDVIQ